MGNGGKWRERERARELRAQSWTLQAIANELGVAKGTVSVWVRDIIDFTPNPRNRGHSSMKPHPMKVKKEAEIERCRVEAEAWVGELTDRELTMFALGLYAGEGSKTNGEVAMANTNPLYLWVFVTWLRRAFQVDESRLKVVLYLHQGLDINAANAYWSELLAIPFSQFRKPYRAISDPTIRTGKHIHGCATVRYPCTLTFRRVMSMISAVSSSVVNPG